MLRLTDSIVIKPNMEKPIRLNINYDYVDLQDVQIIGLDFTKDAPIIVEYFENVQLSVEPERKIKAFKYQDLINEIDLLATNDIPEKANERFWNETENLKDIEKGRYLFSPEDWEEPNFSQIYLHHLENMSSKQAKDFIHQFKYLSWKRLHD